ncbi:MAG: GumC family protein, partial [Pyrinomonadaceae bacterium]
MKESRELIESVHSIQALERPLAPVSNYGLEDAANKEAHFLDYWHAIRKRLWMIIGIVVLATAAEAIYMARQPDIFAAQSRLEVDLENLGATLGISEKSLVLNSQQNDPTYFNTQLQILTGTGLLRRVVRTLDLMHNKSFVEPNEVQNLTTWESFKRMIGLQVDKSKEKNEPVEEVLTSSVASSSVREDLVEAKRLNPYVQVLQKYVSVEPVKESRLSVRETRLIDVRYEHPDPQLAAKIVNAVADTFVLSNLERKTESTVYTGDFLQKRIAELQGEIRTGEEKLLNYAKSNQILSLDPDQNTVVERLVGLNKQLLEAENDRKTTEATYRAALNKGAAEAFAEDNQTQSQTQQKLYELEQKKAQLLAKYTEEWGEVKEVNQQIEVLLRQIQESRDNAVNTVLTKLKTTFQQTAGREQAIRQAYEQQRAETLIQNEAAVNYQIIKQEIETNKKLLDGLLQQSKENDVMLAGTPNNIH